MKPKEAELGSHGEPAEPPGRHVRASLRLRRGHFERVQVHGLVLQSCNNRLPRSPKVSPGASRIADHEVFASRKIAASRHTKDESIATFTAYERYLGEQLASTDAAVSGRLWSSRRSSWLQGCAVAVSRDGTSWIQRYPLEVTITPKEPIKMKGTKRPHRSSRASSR
ncbi:hypothetical protein K466DRAFT_607009 [Polyporus arcularius HHB13444]|uniref:Uncharacterized protein n=1 Tax=Polyporus arcularius HHB13444 TaxID=1314778 RepID=A0A5C3NN33_9APHY|nr:hypothetical protein K466DRAFT_607009 [Polyporus arcularius HHB13444]